MVLQEGSRLVGERVRDSETNLATKARSIVNCNITEGVTGCNR